MDEIMTYELEEILKKSEVYIKSESDFETLRQPGEHFLCCHMEEEKETVIFRYDIEGKKSFLELREEKKIDRLRALLEVAKLAESFPEYRFLLAPENLYYDRNFRVYVKRREYYEPGINGDMQEMRAQYQALTAHVLQKKYVFEDYYMGGMDLYKKNRTISKLAQMEDVEEIKVWLEAAYEQEYKASLEKRVEVNKGWYQLNLWYMVATLVIIAVAAIYILYATVSLLPRKNTMLAAQNSFLDGKYVHVIDNLKNVDMKYMDKHQKYILAVSYVKGESLTQEQKDNVLETITIDGEEKLKDYWIYLGRLNTSEAENIAMQRADDELLLYAYMKEKSILEKDTEISGEEKTNQLEELDRKIEELAKQYETEEETK